MTELRLNGKNDDGTHLSLHDNDGTEFTLRISDTLRATVNQPRLSAVPEQVNETISIKEIQRRLRAGELAEELARENNISIEKIERFSGPILQERIYIIDQAQQVSVRKEGSRDNSRAYARPCWQPGNTRKMDVGSIVERPLELES